MSKAGRYTVLFLAVVLMILAASGCRSSKENGSRKHSESYDNRKFSEEYSKKLNVQLTGKEDKKMVKALSGWLGTPYKYGGASKSGTDCSGFVMNIYQEVYNKKLSRSANDIYEKDVKVIKKSDLRMGDLIFFKIETKKPGHVGIYIKDGKFIHASSKRGVTVNSLEEAYYKKYYFASGRVK